MQSQVPRQRWDVDSFYDPDGSASKIYTRFAALASVSALA